VRTIGELNTTFCTQNVVMQIDCHVSLYASPIPQWTCFN